MIALRYALFALVSTIVNILFQYLSFLIYEGFGSLYIANPDLVERFASAAELNTPDQATFYGGDSHGYTDYPFVEREESIA